MALAELKAHLIQESIAGKTYWLGTPQPPRNGPSVDIHLLPGFDEYLLGYRDRSAVLDPHYANRIVPGGNGIFYPTIVSDGQVVGTWKRIFKKGAVVITRQPFTGLSADEQSRFNAAAQRYGDFLGMPAVIE